MGEKLTSKSVWVVSVVLVAELIGLSWALSVSALDVLPWLNGEFKVVVICVLFGGLGGVTYCMRGVYLNACVRRNWDNEWLAWYVLRPIVSLVLGGTSYLFVKSGLLLLGASQEQSGSQLGIWAVAFIAGLNVDRFLAKIEDIGSTVWGVEPSRQSKATEKTAESNILET